MNRGATKILPQVEAARIDGGQLAYEIRDGKIFATYPRQQPTIEDRLAQIRAEVIAAGPRATFWHPRNEFPRHVRVDPPKPTLRQRWVAFINSIGGRLLRYGR